jgi:spermidine/putrescine transport system substrate-binding protein
MKLSRQIAAAGILALGVAASALAQDNKLRLITWADSCPPMSLANKRRPITWIRLNNEEMIRSPRDGARGSDPRSRRSHVGPQQEFGI